MKTSLWFKLLLVVLATAVLAGWAGALLDDDGDASTGIPDFLPALPGELFDWNPTPTLLGQEFSFEFRPLLNESVAHFLEMHEKSPPALFSAL